MYAVNDDLNMPRALAVVQEVLKSDLPAKEKLATILDFDKVLGLNLEGAGATAKISQEAKELVDKRNQARQEKNWAESDKLRAEIEKQGYIVEDTKGGPRVIKK